MNALLLHVKKLVNTIKKRYDKRMYCVITTPLNTYRGVDYSSLRVTVDTLQFDYYGATVYVSNDTVKISLIHNQRK